MPGTTNFQQFNPTSANQETDSQYTGDAQRVGGAPVNSVFPSKLGNKLFYQLSTMVAAIGQFIANRGFNASDTNLANLVIAFTNALRTLVGITTINVVAFSATPNFDLSLGTTQKIILTGNVTSSTFSNVTNGGVYNFIIKQSAGGANTFIWPTAIPGAAISPTANSNNVQSFLVDDAGKWLNLTAMAVT